MNDMWVDGDEEEEGGKPSERVETRA